MSLNELIYRSLKLDCQTNVTADEILNTQFEELVLSAKASRISKHSGDSKIEITNEKSDKKMRQILGNFKNIDNLIFEISANNSRHLISGEFC